MALTDTWWFTGLADSQFQSGVEITPNKLAGGSTYTGVVLFGAATFGTTIFAVYPIINTIKVGGGNIFEEEAKFEFEFGTYDSSGFHPFSGWTGSFTVSEGTVYDKSCTIDGGSVHLKSTDVLAYRLKVSSNKSSRVANTTMTDFRLKFDYEQPLYTVTAEISPQGSGTVTGTGSLREGEKIQLKAEANSGYKFVKWNDGVTTVSRTMTVTGNATYTAYFELDKINKIYIGTSQPKAIYIGTQEVKGIYIGTTKVYG